MSFNMSKRNAIFVVIFFVLVVVLIFFLSIYMKKSIPATTQNNSNLTTEQKQLMVQQLSAVDKAVHMSNAEKEKIVKEIDAKISKTKPLTDAERAARISALNK